MNQPFSSYRSRFFPNLLDYTHIDITEQHKDGVSLKPVVDNGTQPQQDLCIGIIPIMETRAEIQSSNDIRLDLNQLHMKTITMNYSNLLEDHL
jgi:hypothetical protein